MTTLQGSHHFCKVRELSGSCDVSCATARGPLGYVHTPLIEIQQKFYCSTVGWTLTLPECYFFVTKSGCDSWKDSNGSGAPAAPGGVRRCSELVFRNRMSVVIPLWPRLLPPAQDPSRSVLEVHLAKDRSLQTMHLGRALLTSASTCVEYWCFQPGNLHPDTVL